MSLATQLQSAFTRVGTEFKTVKGTIGTLANLTTTTKTDLVSAVNEVKASVGAAGAVIDDSAASTTKVYSSNKTQTQINAAISGLVNGAGTALDTLKELADALGGDANFATTVSTALGKRLRFDAAQTLTSAEQAQGQTNLVVYSKADIGDPTTDFSATFTAALV